MMEESPPVAAGDYAGNVGTTGYDYTLTIQDRTVIVPHAALQAVKGVRFMDIIDGLGNTLLVGDKHVPRGSEGSDPWDCGIYDGHNPACSTRAAGPDFPLAQSYDDTGWVFGSRHPGECLFLF